MPATAIGRMPMVVVMVVSAGVPEGSCRGLQQQMRRGLRPEHRSQFQDRADGQGGADQKDEAIADALRPWHGSGRVPGQQGERKSVGAGKRGAGRISLGGGSTGKNKNT